MISDLNDILKGIANKINLQPSSLSKGLQMAALARVIYYFYQREPLNKLVPANDEVIFLKLLQIAAFYHGIQRPLDFSCITDKESQNLDTKQQSFINKCISDAEYLEKIRVCNEFKLNNLNAYQDLLANIEFNDAGAVWHFEIGLEHLYQIALARRSMLVKQKCAERACEISISLPKITAMKHARCLVYGSKIITPAIAASFSAHKKHSSLNKVIKDMSEYDIFQKYLTKGFADLDNVEFDKPDCLCEINKLPTSELKLQLMALNDVLDIKESMNKESAQATKNFRKDLLEFVTNMQAPTVKDTGSIKKFITSYEATFGKQRFQKHLPTIDKFISTVAVAACAFMLGAVIGFGIGFVVGAWAGPFAAVSAISGALFTGTKVMACVLGWGILGSTAATTIGYTFAHDKIQEKIPAFKNGLFGQRNLLFFRDQVKTVAKTAEKEQESLLAYRGEL